MYHITIYLKKNNSALHIKYTHTHAQLTSHTVCITAASLLLKTKEIVLHSLKKYYQCGNLLSIQRNKALMRKWSENIGVR